MEGVIRKQLAQVGLFSSLCISVLEIDGLSS